MTTRDEAQCPACDHPITFHNAAGCGIEQCGCMIDPDLAAAPSGQAREAQGPLVERLRACADEVAEFPHPSQCEHLHNAAELMREAAAAIAAPAETPPQEQEGKCKGCGHSPHDPGDCPVIFVDALGIYEDVGTTRPCGCLRTKTEVWPAASPASGAEPPPFTREQVEDEISFLIAESRHGSAWVLRPAEMLRAYALTLPPTRRGEAQE